MQIGKSNFAIAKAAKTFVEAGTPLYALHITNEYTEVTSGTFALRVRHSSQQSFEFLSEGSIDVSLRADDALNIASSLGKDDYIKAVIPSDDQETVQIEFSSGEIRILPVVPSKFPDIPAVYPKDECRFSIAVDPAFLSAVLRPFETGGFTSVALEFWGSHKGIVVKPHGVAADAAEVSAIVMPINREMVELPGVADSSTLVSTKADSSQESLLQ